MNESPVERAKHLSRRGFLKVVIVQAGAAALLSACQQTAPGPTAAPAKPTEAPAAKPTEAPKPAEAAKPAAPVAAPTSAPAAAAPGQAASGGKLKVGVPSSSNTMDPHKQKIGEEYLVAFMVTEALVVIDHDMTPKPQLAESWTSSDDLRTWTFKLVKGARFHDGRELTPDDVIANFKRVLDPATGSPARSNLGVIEDISAPDGNTVKFSLKQPYGNFAAALGERNAKIMPKDKLESAHTAPIGTGPFKFVSFTPGQAAVIAKNPDYRERGVPKLDEVTFRIIPEASAAATALQTGELDMYWQVPLESIESLQSAGIVIDEVPTSSWDAIVMKCNEPPFDNLKLRQAVFYAADRDQLVKGAALGHGTPTYTSIPPNSVAYNKSLALKPDIARAKQLMAEAGFGSGLDIELYIPEGRPVRERLGVIMQQMLAPVGFRIKLQRVPWDKFVADIEGKTKFNADGFFSRPTLDTATYPFYHSSGSWNTLTWHYSNPEVDALLEQARATADQAKANEAYQKFQEIVHLEGPGLVPFVLNHVVGASKKVKDFKAHSMLWLDLRNVSVG